MRSICITIHPAENGWYIDHQGEAVREIRRYVFTNWGQVLEHLDVERVLIVPTEEKA